MTTVSLREVVSVHGGGTPRKSVPTYFGGGVPWVTPKDMKQAIMASSQVTLTPDGVKNSPAKVIPEGSVLVVVRSGVLKHTLPVALTARPVTVNQDMKALVPSCHIDAAYLARFIKARQPRVLGWVRATTADNFPIDNLLDLQIELPPLNEQRRIAAILDRADAIRAKRRQVLAHLDTLAQSIFHDMFGRVPATATLGSLVVEVRYGTSNKAGTDGYPVLRIPNVIRGSLDTTQLKTVQVTPAERNKLRLVDGDLLVVRTNGNPDNVGRCAVFRPSEVTSTGFESSNFVYASYLIRIRPDSSKLESTFVSGFLSSAPGRRAVRSRSKTSAGQYNVNSEGLKSLQIPDVPLSEQREFAARVEQINARRDTVQRALAADDELFASLQSRAFRGDF